MSLRERTKRLVLPKLLKRLNPHWHQLSYLKSLLDLLEVECVLDVGANAGQFGSQLRAAGYSGLIISLEPDPTVFLRLEEAVRRDRKWYALNIALGETRGELQLNIMKRSEFNSFKAPSVAETDLVAGFNSIVRQERVQVHTLAEQLPKLIERFGFTRAFLKMDTQGFDWEVFSGLGGAMDGVVGLQSEIAVVPLYDGVLSWSEMIGRYEAAGFELANLFSISPGFHKLLEFDCYMVRQGLLDRALA